MSKKDPLDFVLKYGRWGEARRAEVCSHGLPPGGCQKCVKRILGRLEGLYRYLGKVPKAKDVES